LTFGATLDGPVLKNAQVFFWKDQQREAGVAGFAVRPGNVAHTIQSSTVSDYEAI
jgi:hypothetical protein